MIKVENIEVFGWQAAIRGMRNPKNSWDKSDSGWSFELDMDMDSKRPIGCVNWEIGKADHELMMRLVKGGSVHAKFRRMITVTMDITAPLYLISELDTYKVGTVRNSCSFMHRGVSKPFSIEDFSHHDPRVIEALTPAKVKVYPLRTKDYGNDEWKPYVCSNGRKYKVYKNGVVEAEAYSLTDTTGRTRHFESHICTPSANMSGYYGLQLGGRNGEKWLLHRLVATVWLDNPNNYYTVNHINGDKGNNGADNLEWCSLQDNIQKAYENGLYSTESTLHKKYTSWKLGHTLFDPYTKSQLLSDYSHGMKGTALANKYGITAKQANNMIFIKPCNDEELFLLCYAWENVIDALNALREQYFETKDEQIFQAIRCLLPSGYNQRFTWQANYEVLANIYASRKNHRLDEWREFCRIMKEQLPYSELFTGEEDG